MRANVEEAVTRTIAERMGAARRAANLTLAEAAAATGISVSQVWGLEQARTSPGCVTLLRLARAYRRPIQWFFGEHAPKGRNFPVPDPTPNPNPEEPEHADAEQLSNA